MNVFVLQVSKIFFNKFLEDIISRVATWPGKVRKSGKTKKNDKSQEKSGKNGGFL